MCESGAGYEGGEGVAVGLIDIGAGLVGRYAGALAHPTGLRVIVVPDPDDSAALESLGAERLIPRGPDAVVVHVDAVAPGGADAVLDSTASSLQFTATARPGGRFASPQGFNGSHVSGIDVSGVEVRDRFRDTAAIAEVAGLVAAGIPPADVAAASRADDAVRANRTFDQGQARGRIHPHVRWVSRSSQPNREGARRCMSGH